jgi:thiamine-phosphate pyrophosphorylase
VSRIGRPCVYVVTDRRRLTPDARTVADEVTSLERWLDLAIGAGADVVQIRERDLEAGAQKALAARVAARARGTLVVVNDRADVALAARVDGVHLRGDGPPIDRVRRLGGRDWLVGRSVHTTEEAARHNGADYLVFGTVFPGGSKPEGAPVAGLEGLRAAVTAAAGTPVIAIGGITPARAASCAVAGAVGVAGIGVFLPEGRAPDALGPVRAVAALRAAFER